MTETSRDTRLLETLVTLADTLVADYDVVDLLQRLVESCQELVGATACGILLADRDERLEVIASSDDDAKTIELLQVASGTGPCVECFRSGVVVSVPDVTLDDTWPSFQRAAAAIGFRSVHAVPLRLRDATIGSMNLFGAEPRALDKGDALAARTLADIATIGILQERAVREASIAREQLQRALDSRVVIEQAKGVISYRRGVTMGEAFDLIRGYARHQRLGIGVVSAQIVDRSLEL